MKKILSTIMLLLVSVLIFADKKDLNYSLKSYQFKIETVYNDTVITLTFNCKIDRCEENSFIKLLSSPQLASNNTLSKEQIETVNTAFLKICNTQISIPYDSHANKILFDNISIDPANSYNEMINTIQSNDDASLKILNQYFSLLLTFCGFDILLPDINESLMPSENEYEINGSINNMRWITQVSNNNIISRIMKMKITDTVQQTAELIEE